VRLARGHGPKGRSPAEASMRRLASDTSQHRCEEFNSLGKRMPRFSGVLAEGAGFEPAIRFPAYTLSRRAPSTARPPLRLALRSRSAKARRIAPGARPAQAGGPWRLCGRAAAGRALQKTHISQHQSERRRIFQIHSPMGFDCQKEEPSPSLQATPSLPKPIGVRRGAVYRVPAWDPAIALRAGRGRSI
jgi:hypothetical protein